MKGIKTDIERGEIGTKSVMVRRKLRLGGRRIHLDPPVPKKSVPLRKEVYARVKEGDQITLHYAPVSKRVLRID